MHITFEGSLEEFNALFRPPPPDPLPDPARLTEAAARIDQADAAVQQVGETLKQVGQ